MGPTCVFQRNICIYGRSGDGPPNGPSERGLGISETVASLGAGNREQFSLLFHALVHHMRVPWRRLRIKNDAAHENADTTEQRNNHDIHWAAPGIVELSS